jgi:cysteine desulfurase
MIPYYFDWAATTPMCPRALLAYQGAAIEHPGNPSSLHKMGLDAARFLTEQREESASLLGVDSKNIIYTGGATESNSIPILSQLWKRTPGRILLGSLEHDSILQYKHLLEQKGFEVVFVPAKGGYVDPDALAQRLTVNTQLVCIMLVNNALGTIQPIENIAKRIREFESEHHKSIHLHCDAVQALGKIPMDLMKLDVDSASFSAHKFQGPRGVGMLYQKNNTLVPLSRGGGQEAGLRPGTENVAGIAAQNAALRLAIEHLDENLLKAIALRKIFEDEIAKAQHIEILSPKSGSQLAFSPYIIALSVDSVPSEVFSRIMYDKGFCISSGSACSNNAKNKSADTLNSMGFSHKQTKSMIRVSFGSDTKAEDMVLLARTMHNEADKLQKIMRKR